MTSEAVMVLKIPAREVSLVRLGSRLMDEDCLPSEMHFDAESGCYVIEIAGDRAAHILELIDLGSISRGAETYTERLARSLMQQPLPFHEQR